MNQATEKSEIGSPIPAPSNEGKESAGIVSEQECMKLCPNPYCGCISSYWIEGKIVCSLSGPCDPCDNNGNRFTVREWVENGQKFQTREYGPKPVPAIIDAEDIQNNPLTTALRAKREPRWALAQIRQEIQTLMQMQKAGVINTDKQWAAFIRIRTLTGAL
jgi:hypothetical protein